MKTTKTVDLSRYHDTDVKSVTVRVISGPDVVAAAEAIGDLEGGAFGLNLRLQMIARSITEVDGKAVQGEVCSAFFDWSKRTQDFAAKAYEYLNNVNQKEDDDFQAQLAGAPAASQQTASTPA